MDKQTLKALKGAIKKWHTVAYHGGIDKGRDNCPLCILTDRRNPKYGYFWDCKGCLIQKHTGKNDCSDTPYVRWNRIAFDKNPAGFTAVTDVQKRAAEEELEFLVTLLPEGEEAEMPDGWIWYWEWK
jgi:hypothetical protein